MTDWAELKRLAEEACNGNLHLSKSSAFIAAANPKIILALIAENEKLRTQPTSYVIDDEREQFIKASRPFYRPDYMAWDYGQDRFYDDHVQRAWRLWQVRAALKENK